MIESCGLAREILDKACEAALTGRSLLELDEYVGDLMKSEGCISAPKELGFPSFACYSVNCTALHGVASEYRLKEGDLLSIDVSLKYNGLYGDNCRTIEIGRPDSVVPILLAAYKAREAGISMALVGNTPAMIGKASEEAAKEAGFCTAWQYGGHGIGKKLHMSPFIPAYDNGDNEHIFKAGDYITVEPTVIEHGYRLNTLPDGWTIKDVAGKLSAQFEHTIQITKWGPKILT